MSGLELASGFSRVLTEDAIDEVVVETQSFQALLDPLGRFDGVGNQSKQEAFGLLAFPSGNCHETSTGRFPEGLFYLPTAPCLIGLHFELNGSPRFHDFILVGGIDGDFHDLVIGEVLGDNLESDGFAVKGLGRFPFDANKVRGLKRVSAGGDALSAGCAVLEKTGFSLAGGIKEGVLFLVVQTQWRAGHKIAKFDPVGGGFGFSGARAAVAARGGSGLGIVRGRGRIVGFGGGIVGGAGARGGLLTGISGGDESAGFEGSQDALEAALVGELGIGSGRGTEAVGHGFQLAKEVGFTFQARVAFQDRLQRDGGLAGLHGRMVGPVLHTATDEPRAVPGADDEMVGHGRLFVAATRTRIAGRERRKGGESSFGSCDLVRDGPMTGRICEPGLRILEGVLLRAALLPGIVWCGLGCVVGMAEEPGEQLNDWLARRSDKRLQATFELRQRWEDRVGPGFGRDRDVDADFLRARFGLRYQPKGWIKLVGLAQDARVAAYGVPAPGNVRDPLDLQEGYVELFSASQTGWGLTAGRQMLGYGDTRLIGSPQWAYTARTWDVARVYYVTRRVRLEAVHLSPIVPRGEGFNRPILGDRIFGVYSTWKGVAGAKSATDFYLLRHQQNRLGGYTGAGEYGVNILGSRWAVPLSESRRITVEVVGQNGQVGLLPHRALGWVAQYGQKFGLRGKNLDWSTEYKYASGTRAGSGRSGTFDQLYPAAHDKLGHVDLLGWRNVHNVRSFANFAQRKNWQWTLMYNATWLASKTDWLYSAQGRAIARVADGSAGRYAGQELDLFSTYQREKVTVSAGVGQFFPGEFVRRATPGVASRLLYLATSYSF